MGMGVEHHGCSPSVLAPGRRLGRVAPYLHSDQKVGVNLDLVGVYLGEVVVCLKAYPCGGGAPESLFQTNGHLGRNRTLPGEDVGKRLPGNAEPFCGLGNR